MRRLLSFLLTAALLLTQFPASLAAEPEDGAEFFTTEPKISDDIALLSNGTVYHWYAPDYSRYDPDDTGSPHPSQIEGLERIVDVSLEMALDADGVVWTWGLNKKGQLGDGTTENRNEPKPVEIPGRVTAISARYSNKAAVTEDGSLYIWGANDYGQLGMSSDYNAHPTPVKVEGLGPVQDVALGYSFVLALMKDGTLWTWGNNSYGQLGRGNSGSYYSTPGQAQGLDGLTITSIFTGSYSCFALCADGTVWSWGGNFDGQLGHSGSSAQKMTGLENIVDLASSDDYTLAIDKDGALWACGVNYYGEFGNKQPPYYDTEINPAIRIDEVPQPAVAVATGTTSILIMEDGIIQSPGGSNRFNGETDYFRPLTYESGLEFCADRFPLEITDGSEIRVTGVASGLHPAGEPMTLYAVLGLCANWKGWTTEGIQFADPMALEQHFSMPNGPASISVGQEAPIGIEAVPDLSPGSHAVTALRSDGTMWVWGNDLNGQLGDGDPEDGGLGPDAIRSSPMLVQTFEKNGMTPLCISTGTMHTLAQAGSSVWAWGDNRYRQLGTSGTSNRTSPATCSYDSRRYGVIDLAAGEQFSATLDTDHKVWYWGYDIIQGANTQSSPVEIPGLSDSIKLAAGPQVLLALKADGTVWIAGQGSTPEERQARQVEGLEHIMDISVGGSYFLALKQDGTVWAWGDNSSGQLGNGHHPEQ